MGSLCFGDVNLVGEKTRRGGWEASGRFLLVFLWCVWFAMSGGGVGKESTSTSKSGKWIAVNVSLKG